MPKKILFSDESKTVYEDYKSSLEKTWDSLSSYYQQKAMEYQAEHMSKQSLVTKFQAARVELETISTTYKLLKDKVVKCINVRSKTESKINLTKKIVTDASAIIKKKLEMLRDTIQKEKTLCKDIEKYNCAIENGVLKIIIDNNHYIVVEGGKYVYPKKYVPKGLRCTIVYKEMKFIGNKQCASNLNEIDSVIEYCKEKNALGNFNHGIINIVIEEGCEVDSGDEICLLIIEKLKKGYVTDIVFEIVICFLSKFTWRGLVKENYVILDGLGNKMIDGLSKEYYVVCNIGILRVNRSESGFMIYVNENELILPKKLH